MSYAEATLDLSSTPVVCLTGLNGAGKSALLDALTWSLWESGRSSSDEMVRLGEKEMWVDLVFEHEGAQYRVRRSRQKMSAKAGAKITSKGSLDFQIFNKQRQLVPASARSGQSYADLNEGSWRSLTGASVRQTQKQITDLLRMDFDTFVNSAYLRQGKADEFTTRPPSERKQLLSDILGLSYFDRLQEKAKEHARELKVESELMARDLVTMPALEKLLKSAQKQLAQTKTSLSEADCELTRLEADLTESAQMLTSLSLSLERLRLGEEHAKSITFDIESLVVQRDALSKDIKKLQSILERGNEIEQGTSLFDALKVQVEELDAHAFDVQELTTQKMSFQHQLATMRARLEVELASASAKASELEEKTERITKDTGEKDKITLAYAQYKRSVADEADMATRQETFARMTNRATELAAQITESKIRLEADLFQKEQSLVEHETILHSRSNLEAQKLELEKETKHLDKLETEFQLIEETGIKLKSNIEKKTHKIETIKHQQQDKNTKINELHHHADSSMCPLCSAPIVDRAAVVDCYRNEISALEYEIDEETAAIENLERERASLRKRYTEIRHSLERRQFLDKQIGQYNEKLMAIERAGDSKQKIERDVVTLQSRLRDDNYAQLERESLIGVKAELHKLEFDPIAYANIQSQIRMQRHVEVRYQQMHRDLLDLKKINETLPSLQEQVKQLQDELGGESYGQVERKSLADLMHRLASFNYDRNLHAQLKEKLSALLPLVELRRELHKAQLEQPKLEESLHLCNAQLAGKNEQLQAFQSEKARLQDRLKSVPELQARVESLKPLMQQSRENKEELAKTEAVFDSECRHLQIDLARLNQAQDRLRVINEKLDDHLFLAEAFGKKGIQAVIIENAIPEIETEANRILSRLTENKMHVAFITQQKNKSGGMMETLELVIGDEGRHQKLRII